MNKKKLALNILAQLLTFGSSMLIGLVITPQIVAKLGFGAYSYIGIANDFASYVTIITTALNSMAGRFISIELNKGNRDKAKVYFSSVFIADVVLAFAAMVLGIVLTLNINGILKNISPELLIDVKITFSLVFFNMVVNLLMSVYSVAPFVTDNLQKSAVRGVFSNLIKVILLIVLFTFLPARIYFVTISIIGTSIFLIVTNVILSKQLLPDFKVNIHNFSFDAIKTLNSSGVWNSLNTLSNMLLTGLAGLLTTNFVSPKAGGLLYTAKTVPLNFAQLITTLATIFTPHFVMLYAKGNIKGLLKDAKYTMKILPFLMIVPIAGYLAFGASFFKLWQYAATPEDLHTMQILSIFSMGTNLLSIYVYPLTSINTTTNKLKWPVITTFMTGLLSISTVLILLNVTNIGVYVVNFVSTVFSMLRLFFFVPMYSAHNLKLKLTTFYPTILRGLGAFAIVEILFILVHNQINVYIDSWFTLVVAAIICGVPGYLLVYLILFNKEEKKKVWDMVMRKLKRVKK